MLRAAVIPLSIALAFGALTPAGLAQLPDPQAPVEDQQSPEGEADAPSQPDLTALRYYIDQGDWARVEAELRRLRQDYPDWEPPQDLLGDEAPAPSVDVQPLWDLFGEGDYAGVRARIAELEEQYPDWEPPEDLLRELDLAEARQRLVVASDQGQWQRVLDIARQLPGLLTCARVDNVWRTAQAYAELDQLDNAIALWRTVVDTCSNLDERVATIQKANAYVGVEQLEALIAAAISSAPEDEGRFLQVRADLLAGRGLEPGEVEDSVVRPGDDGAPVVILPQPQPIAPRAPTGPTGPPPAPPGPSVAERAAEAQQMANYARCLDITEGAEEIGARLVRAWCLFELDRPTEANLLFDAVYGAASEPDITQSAGFGRVLSLLRANRLAEAGTLMRQITLTAEQSRDIEAEILAQRATSAYEFGQFREVIRLVEARRALGVPDRRDLNVILAWSYYERGDLRVAESMFEQLDQVFSTPESREGLHVVREARYSN